MEHQMKNLTEVFNSFHLAEINQADGKMTVTMQSELPIFIEVDPSLHEQVLARDPEVLERLRQRACEQFVIAVFERVASDLIVLRQKSAKKYHPDINRILANVLGGASK
jgi:hypothetical protein